jgi:hypothetical protein
MPSLPGQITVADALAVMPAGTNRTNFTNDFNQLLTDMTTAVGNGGMNANIRDALFYPMLMDFAQALAKNCAL